MASALLVEDTALIRKLLATVLIKGGFQVFETSNGEEALQLINQTLPDIIVCDLEMPVMDGRTFVKHFRSNSAYNKIPLVILSADHDDSTRKELLNIGATQIINKGIAPQEIVNLLYEIIETVRQSE